MNECWRTHRIERVASARDDCWEGVVWRCCGGAPVSVFRSGLRSLAVALCFLPLPTVRACCVSKDAYLPSTTYRANLPSLSALMQCVRGFSIRFDFESPLCCRYASLFRDSLWLYCLEDLGRSNLRRCLSALCLIFASLARNCGHFSKNRSTSSAIRYATSSF